MSVEVRLLGGARITVDGQVFDPQVDRRSALLYYLAHTGGWVAREDLLYLFWPDTEENLARTSLRALLHTLRSFPYASGLQTDRTRVMWDVQTDLDTWKDATPKSYIELTWPGELLDGFRLRGAPEFESWLELEREAWRAMYRTRLLAAAKSADSDDAGGISRCLDSWLLREPLDEEAVRASIDLMTRSGHSLAARTRYTTFKTKLKDEYGVEPDPMTRSLIERVYGGVSDHATPGVNPAAVTVVADVTGNQQRRVLRPKPLPRATSGTFLGRTSELARLERELTTGRGAVVTILAPGGMGKSRLAREVTELVRPYFQDGVVYVPLASVREPSQVAPALADAFGIESMGVVSATEEVELALKDKQMLVLLDNLEQIDAAAGLIDSWSALAPSTVWLLTSRELVGTSSEVVIELSGLGRPPPGGEPQVAHESVALLLDRALRAGRPLDLRRDGRAITDIVRLTGGMPLAIELAAGWLRAVPPEVIAAELISGIDLVASSERQPEARHKSVRTVIESAWNALGATERSALLRLAVFEGGFDEPAAREAADVGRPQLLALRNKSMLDLNRTGRYGWHPLLESFIKEQLVSKAPTGLPSASGSKLEAATRRRHARYYLDLVALCTEQGRAGQPLQAIATLRREHQNIEAAWMQAIELRWWDSLPWDDPKLAVSFAIEGRYHRWHELLTNALEAVPGQTVPWAALEILDSLLDLEDEKYEQAYLRQVAAVSVLREHGDPYKLGWGLLHLGVSAFAMDQPNEAAKLTMEAVNEFKRSDRLDLLGKTFYNLFWQSMEPREHERWFRQFIDWYESNGSDEHLPRVLWFHGMYISLVYGEHHRGAGLIRQALTTGASTDWNPYLVRELHYFLAKVLACAGDHVSALAQLDTFDAFVSESLPSGRDETAYRGQADALRAELSAQTGREVPVSLLAPGSEAADTLAGLRLRTDFALGRHDLTEADVLLEQLQERTPRGIGTVIMADLQVETHLLSARVALAKGARARAADDLTTTIELALNRHMLPRVLQALLASTDLLDEELATLVRAVTAQSAALPYFLRQTAEETSLPTVQPATDWEEEWAAVSALSVRVIDFLKY